MPKTTIDTIKTWKNRDEAFVCLTAYTTPMAHSLAPHVDLLLVGDSMGTTIYGMDNTTTVSINMMIAHGAAVICGVEQYVAAGANKGEVRDGVPVIVDMSYGTYEHSVEDALKNAQRIMDETGAQGVKLEGGVDMQAQISALTKAGIPVMGHIGLQPQSVIKEGGYKIKGKDEQGLAQLIEDAKAVEAAGAFSVVIEGTIAESARAITDNITIPTIGIGASSYCDGQVLVSEDMLGMLHGHQPKFVTEYAHLRDTIDTSVARFSEDVRARNFPREENLYRVKKKA